MAENRRHAAIMFTDIVGYTSLMGSDEDRAFEVLSRNREIHNKLIEQFNGTLIKEMGDGMLISFNLASDAVYCAIEIQKACKAHEIPLKIGIHEGEMVFEGADVLGDAVNVASRLESGTKEGCIYISGSVYRDIKNRTDIHTKYIKEKTFKNVDEPIKVYQVLCENEPNQPVTNNKEKRSSKKPFYLLAGVAVVAIAIIIVWKFIPTKQVTELEKSIAVKPFWNESNDTTNMYFVNGMMEDIRNNLSKISDIRVISRTTMEKYRETKLTTSEIAKELGVSYLLEGSVQKIGNQVKIHAQLIDADEDDHLWQDTYIKDISDIRLIFEIQSDIAKTIAEKIGANIKSVEGEHIDAIPTSSPLAYDYYLRGKEYIYRSYNMSDIKFASKMFQKVIHIDSTMALAWIGLARCSGSLLSYGGDKDSTILKMEYYLRKAKDIDSHSIEVRREEGKYLFIIKRNYDGAYEILKELDTEYPNDDETVALIGRIFRERGELKKSIDYYSRAINLNPASHWHWNALGSTYVIMKDYDQAESSFFKSLELNPSNFMTYELIIRLYLLTGDLDLATQFIKDNSEWLNQTEAQNSKFFISDVFLYKGEIEKSIDILKSIPDEYMDIEIPFIKYHMLATIYLVASDNQYALMYYTKAKNYYENFLPKNPRTDVKSWYAEVLAGMSIGEDALRIIQEILSDINLEHDRYNAFYYDLQHIRILILLHNYEEAINRLDDLIKLDGRISVNILKLDPFWNPLRDMEGFKTIINNPAYQVKSLTN